MRPTLIPITILILRNPEGHVEYKAFSPKEYVTDTETRRALYDKFMSKLYEHISYDPISSNTNMGKLIEVHTRFIRIPLSKRRETIHFNGYSHEHCDYKPIHSKSPIQFTNEFISTEGLTHIIATHEHI